MLYRKYYLYRAQPFFAGSKRKQEGGILLVLVYGGIEENCTIKAMFNTKQDEESDVVPKILFV